MKKLAYLASGILAITLLLSWPANSYADQAFYTIDKTARQGMMVSLSKNPGVVEPTDITNAASLVGVIDPGGNNLEVQNGQVNVRTEGVVNVLVTTIGGDIKVGDRIAPSTIVGLGAKQAGSGWVVGTAQGSLDSSTGDAVKTNVTESSGQHRQVYAASIPVLIKVTYITAEAAQNQSGFLASLQKAADTIVGKHASMAAVILGFLILIVGLAIATLIITTTIRSGLKGISRQPLSRKQIVRQMTRSTALGVGILLLAIFGSMSIVRFL